MSRYQRDQRMQEVRRAWAARLAIASCFALSIAGLVLVALAFLAIVAPASGQEFAAVGNTKPIYELKGNESTPARIELGKLLFTDTNLSADKQISCARCHDPGFAFTMPDAAAVGVNGQIGRRNAPTIINACFKLRLFHDGRVAHLEGQAAFPLLSAGEHGMTEKSIADYLKSKPLYVELFKEAYDEEPSFMGAVKALSCFERELVSFNAPIDRWLDGETWALDERQKIGAAVFINATEHKGFSEKDKLALMSSTAGIERWRGGFKGSCTSCHGGQDFSDDHDGELRAHNVGSTEYTVDRVLAIMTDDRVGQAATPDDGKVVTPTLREVQLTGPWGFRGQWPTIEAVIDFKERGGDETRNPSVNLMKYKWTKVEKEQLAHFLRTAFAGDFRERIAEMGIVVKP